MKKKTKNTFFNPAYPRFMIAFLPLMMLLTYSCTSQKKNQFDSIKIDIDHSKNIDPQIITNSIQLIKLETSRESMIGKPKKLVIHQGDIFILDSKQQALLKFDSKGKFITKIHRIGKGPGEYIRISDFCIDKKHDQIILLANGRDLLFYSCNGDFIKHINLGNLFCHFLTYLEDDNILLYSETSEYRFYHYSHKDKKIIQRNIKGNDFIQKTGMGHLYTPFFQNNDDSYSFTDIYSYKIFNISSKEVLCKSLDFGKYSYKIEKLPLDIGKNSYKEHYLKLASEGKYALNIFYFFETSDYTFVSYLFDRRTQTSILDKKSKNNYRFDQYQFPEVIYYKDDCLHGLVEPLSIGSYIPKGFEIDTFNVNINDNPVVITYQF